MVEVLIYSTPECHICKRVKAFLKEHNIDYNNIDVESDQEKAKEMIEKSGQMGVPVVIINGNMLIQPSNEQLKKALKLE